MDENEKQEWLYETFEIDEDNDRFLGEHAITDGNYEIVETLENGDKIAKLKPEVAKDLERTYNLFTSYKPHDEYEEEACKSLVHLYSEAFKELGQNPDDYEFECDISEDRLGGVGAYVTIKNKKDGYSVNHEPHGFYYNTGDMEHIYDGMQDWNWLAWLAHHDSPLYRDEFREAYAETEVMNWMSEIIGTSDGFMYWNEKSLKEAIEELTEEAEAGYSEADSDAFEDEIFKCSSCGEKYKNSFCATDDVSICRWCSGEEGDDDDESEAYAGNFKKIDCYFDGEYLHSTNSYKTCKEAKEAAIKNAERIIKNEVGYSKNMINRAEKMLADPSKIKCVFAGAQADSLPGGLADKNKPEDFDQEQLKKGIEVEMEHTNDPKLAEEIAMDHLAEIPDYYDRLSKMEKGAESNYASNKTELCFVDHNGNIHSGCWGDPDSEKNQKKLKDLKSETGKDYKIMKVEDVDKMEKGAESKAHSKFKLYCNQRGTFFPSGEEPEEYKSLDDIKDQLIEYHKIDMSDEELIEFQKMSAKELAEIFDWEIVESNYIDNALNKTKNFYHIKSNVGLILDDNKVFETNYEGNDIVVYFYENPGSRFGYSFMVDFGDLFYDEESEQGIHPSVQYPIRYENGNTAWENSTVIPKNLRFDLEYAMQMFEDYVTGEMEVPYDENNSGSAYSQEEADEFIKHMQQFDLKIEKAEGDSICWEGYERVPGTEPYSEDSCRKKSEGSDMKTYQVRPYFGHDCDSVSGWNNGYYLDEIYVKADSPEEASEKAMEEYCKEYNIPLDKDDNEMGDFMISNIKSYSDPDGNEITKEEFEEAYENDPDRHEDYGYTYEYIDFAADVAEVEFEEDAMDKPLTPFFVKSVKTYKTKEEAEKHIKEKGLDNVEVVETEEGFIIQMIEL